MKSIGQEAYCQYVPKKYRKKDVKQLLSEQRFVALYNKHGEKIFNEYITKIKKADIVYESGSKFKKNIYAIKAFIKKKIIPSTTAVMLALPASSVGVVEMENFEENKKYAEQIQDYLMHIDEFGKEVRTYNMNDIQNFMFVMDDMWTNTKGYKSPEIDLTQYGGLDLATEEGYGVCRNMADDAARKLNAINKEYNARAVGVYYKNGKYKVANIKEKTPQYTDESAEQTDSEATNIIKKIFGNHCIVLCHSLEDNVELALDVTNPGIGVVTNGKIEMFNSYSEKPLEMSLRPLSSFVFGKEMIADVPQNYYESLGFYDNDKMNYLRSKYSIDAQNKAISEVREIKPKSFYDSVKVEIQDLGSNIKITSKEQDKNVKER